MDQETEIVEQFTYEDIKKKSESSNRNEFTNLKLEYEDIIEGSIEWSIAHKRIRNAAGYPSVRVNYDYKDGKISLKPLSSGLFIGLEQLSVKYKVKV